MKFEDSTKRIIVGLIFTVLILIPVSFAVDRTPGVDYCPYTTVTGTITGGSAKGTW